MRIKYKEEPRAWRKSALLSVLALMLVSSLFRWRHLLSSAAWAVTIIFLIAVAGLAWFVPQLFRGYYRFSTWAGFWSSQAVARVALGVIFLVLITPAGFIMGLLGKDPLRLKRSPQATSYWLPAKPQSPLDRSF